MTKDDVAAVLGPPEESDVHFLREAYEDRLGSSVITIYGNRSVTFEDTDLFHAPGMEVIKRLADADGKPLETVGIPVFLNLGITMTGFLQEDEPGQKSISVFAKGRWDSEIGDLKPFKMIIENRSQ
jgi:hypothetical protein